MSIGNMIRRFLRPGLIFYLLIASTFIIAVSAQAQDPTSEPIVGPSAQPMPVSFTQQAPNFAAGGVTKPGAAVDVQLGGINEPTLVVNPLDSTNIAMASLFRLRVSTTNGTNFTAATAATVPATHVLCGDPSLAFDSQGRLFWTYLGCISGTTRPDIFIARVNPTTGAIMTGYPINVTASAGVNLPAASGFSHDKEWLAADNAPGSASPFQDRLHIVWTEFPATGGTVVHTTFSTDQGQTWSAPTTLSAAGEGGVWPSHIAVAQNGDVYVAYHSQPTFANGAPNGTSGQVFMLRSTDGGVTFPQKTTPFTAGNADITFNVQTAGTARTLNNSVSWTQGSAQPWVLPDPINANNVYVVAADDPTNAAHGGANDDMDIFIARSTNQGVNWNAPTRVDAGPAGTIQFFPTAAIDERSQCLVVSWYDTRGGATNAAGNFLLDYFIRYSCDGGLNFGQEVRLNDVRFDPDLGAQQRYAGPPATLRIGEYNGVAIINGVAAHAVFTGNTTTGQQILYDNDVVAGAVDIYFIVDLSGSFADDLANFKSQAQDIVNNLTAANNNTWFGIGRFEDYPINPFGSSSAGDKAYERLEDLTSNSAQVLATVAGLSTRNGVDLPESQLTALYQAATGAGQDLSGPGYPGASIPAGQQANFRNGATKVFLLWTDAEFHLPGDPGDIPYPGPSFADTAAAILALDPPIVVGISSGTEAIPDLEAIASATDALAPEGGVDCDDNGTVDILEGDPIVCSIGLTGAGVGDAIAAIVEAAIEINQPPMLTVPSDQTVQYSDHLSFDISATDAEDQNALTFQAADLPSNLSLTDHGDGTATISGIVDEAPGTYVVQISVTDPDGLADFKTVAIIVTQEDARATYTGPLLVSTSCADCSTASVPLRATIQDITAVGGDMYSGDITNATVQFVDRDNFNAVLCSASVILFDPVDSEVGTAMCDWNADIGGSDGQEFTVGIIVGGYYTRNSATDDSIVAISKPGENFITGGGYLINENAAGEFAGDTGLKTNFGMNVKFNQTGKRLQGHVTILVRQGEQVYRIKSNALSSLVVVPYEDENPATGTAEFYGRANIQDVTDPENPVSVDGNATLHITMDDNGEPGLSDTLGITVWSKTGMLLFSSNWSGVATVEQTLDAGNLQVH